jgi:hypothetical protein
MVRAHRGAPNFLPERRDLGLRRLIDYCSGLRSSELHGGSGMLFGVFAIPSDGAGALPQASSELCEEDEFHQQER